MKRTAIVIVLLVSLFALFSCANMTGTQQRTLSGAAIGAGGGAILGTIVGGAPLAGAAVGAAVGGLAGYITGESHEGYYRRR